MFNDQSGGRWGARYAAKSEVIERGAGHKAIRGELEKVAGSGTKHDIKKDENDNATTKKERRKK